MHVFSFIFSLFFFLVPILVMITFIYTFIIMLSPKARSKMLKKNFRAVKYFYDENAQDITNLNTKNAEISKEGIRMTSKAVKEGFTDSGDIYCKKCGGKIDSDSAYCKHCGSSVD